MTKREGCRDADVIERKVREMQQHQSLQLVSYQVPGERFFRFPSFLFFLTKEDAANSVADLPSDLSL